MGVQVIAIDGKNLRVSYDRESGSKAEVAAPEECAHIIAPLIQRDSYSSFCHQVYALALKHGNKEQEESLMEAIKGSIPDLHRQDACSTPFSCGMGILPVQIAKVRCSRN